MSGGPCPSDTSASEQSTVSKQPLTSTLWSPGGPPSRGNWSLPCLPFCPTVPSDPREVASVSCWELHTGSFPFFVHLQPCMLALPVPIFLKEAREYYDFM